MNDLYRGVSLSEKKMVYGGLMLGNDYELWQNEGRAFIMQFPRYLSTPNLTEVDPETIGMNTGLPDSTGKMMFTNDICQMKIGDGPALPSLMLISIRHGAVGFMPLQPELLHPDDREWEAFLRDGRDDVWDSEYFTIVGNAQENSELLGGVEDGQD